MESSRGAKKRKTMKKESFEDVVTTDDREDDEEDDDDIANGPPVPSHSEAFKSLSTSLRWLEVQDDCDPVSLQLLRRLQQNAASKRATKLLQRRTRAC